MRNIKLLIITALILMIFVGCNKNDNLTKNTDSKIDKTEDKNDEEWEDIEGSKRRIVHLFDFKQTYSTGPFKIFVDQVQVAEIKPSEELKPVLGNRDKVTCINLTFKVENTSDETLLIMPNQAKLTTNTDEQVDADLLLSDDLGGEYNGKVSKEGKVTFYCDTDASELSTLKVTIKAPFNKKHERVGDKLDIDIKL